MSRADWLVVATSLAAQTMCAVGVAMLDDALARVIAGALWAGAQGAMCLMLEWKGPRP